MELDSPRHHLPIDSGFDMTSFSPRTVCSLDANAANAEVVRQLGTLQERWASRRERCQCHSQEVVGDRSCKLSEQRCF